MAVAGELGMPPLLGYCHLGLGMLFARAGTRGQGRHHLATAGAMFRDMGMRPGTGRRGET